VLRRREGGPIRKGGVRKAFARPKPKGAKKRAKQTNAFSNLLAGQVMESPLVHDVLTASILKRRGSARSNSALS